MNIDTPEGMAQAVALQQALIDSISAGGRWIVPRSGSIFMLDQEGKRAMCVYGGRLPKTDRVFAAMGWTVVPQVGPPDTSPLFVMSRTVTREEPEPAKAKEGPQLKLF